MSAENDWLAGETKMRPVSCFVAIAGSLLLEALLASGAVADTAPAAAAATEPATWQKHQYSFVFMGFTTTYSCDGLADKLKLLLRASGARPDAKVLEGPCARSYGQPDKFARADLTFYTLAPATGGQATETPPVEGTWLPVTIAEHTPRDLARGDCELVEQFRSSVLPMFTTRGVDNHTTCIPHQESGSNIDLKFEVLAAKPKPHPAKSGAAVSP